MRKITVEQLGKTFKKFQDAHPECPNMYMSFNSFMADKGIKAEIRYQSGHIWNACYIASYSTESFEALYKMMIKDIRQYKKNN